MNKKIKTFAQIVKIAAKARKEGKTVGLITGCFDIIHAGHVALFRFAKKHCDLVIVGLDSDETIKMSKGEGRPIHNLAQRESVLAELSSVDFIFGNGVTIKFGTERAKSAYHFLLAKIRPDYLVTSPVADKYWREKEKQAEQFGVKLLKSRGRKGLSTTAILCA